MIIVGSGIESDATWLSGIMRAVGLDVHRVEDVDRRAPGAHAAQLAPDVIDLPVHPLLHFGEQAFQITDVHCVPNVYAR